MTNRAPTLQRLTLFIAAAVLAACGGDDSAQECSITGQNNFVFQQLTDDYLWRDFVNASANPASFDSPNALLQALKRQDGDSGGIDDVYSFITDQGAFTSLLEDGQFTGIGVRFDFDDSDDHFATYVIDGSPVGNAGLLRGDLIQRINGVAPTVDRSGDFPRSNISSLLGPNDEGVPVEIAFSRNGGATQTINVTKRVVTIDSTQVVTRTTTTGGADVGYMLFTNFFGTKSRDELNNAFTNFSSDGGVDELILDLRYNGGGSVTTSTVLGSLIAGTDNEGGVLSNAQANPDHPEYEFIERLRFADNMDGFAQAASALDINRVFVITTASSCSASELVINGLEPYMDVVVVGGTTCGKPVGQFSMNFCDKTAALVNFQTVNANGQGDYFDGIAPDCAVEDDWANPLDVTGDTGNEASIQRALNVIGGTATCTSGAVAAQRKFTAARPNAVNGWRQWVGAY